MEQLTDLKAILHSKRANIYYLEKCRVMVKDGRVLFISILLAACRTYNQALDSEAHPSLHLAAEKSTRKSDFRGNFLLHFPWDFCIFISIIHMFNSTQISRDPNRYGATV
jgi:hypothetical protein